MTHPTYSPKDLEMAQAGLDELGWSPDGILEFAEDIAELIARGRHAGLEEAALTVKPYLLDREYLVNKIRELKR